MSVLLVFVHRAVESIFFPHVKEITALMKA